MRRTRLWLLMAVVAVPAQAISTGCSKIPDGWPETPTTRVLTSFAPVHCFALNVAGPDAAVQVVMSDNGPHHFEAAPGDAAKLERAGLFIINGLELDNGIAKAMRRGSRNQELKLVEAADRIPKSSLREGYVCRVGGHEHTHGSYDPHVWMGLPEAIQMVERIRDALVEADPAHADGYRSRAAAYVEKLQKLHADGKEMLKDKKERKLVTFHDSLYYFARSFDLEILDVIEPTPGTEAQAKHLMQLIDKCKAQGIRHITVEPQYPTNTSAGTVLEDLKRAKIQAEFVLIDTIETALTRELSDPDLYERKMRENLKNLANQLK